MKTKLEPTAWLVHAEHPYVTNIPPAEGGLPRTPLYAIPDGWELVREDAHKRVSLDTLFRELEGYTEVLPNLTPPL
jgi:hypothetical protein